MLIHPFDQTAEAYSKFPYITWTTAGILDSNCDSFSYLKFPFDTQTCDIILEIMNLDRSNVQLRCDSFFACGLDGVSMASFLTTSDVWKIDNNEICICREESRRFRYNVTASAMRFSFAFKRKPQSYIAAIWVPLYVLWALQLGAVALPPKSSDRPAFSMTVVLSFVVVLTMVLGMVPVSSELSYLEMIVVLKFCASSLLTIYTIIVVAVGEHPVLKHGTIFGISRLRALDSLVIFVIVVIVACFDIWAFNMMIS